MFIALELFNRDMMADANILQGAIFHDDVGEDTDEIFAKNSPIADGQNKASDDVPRTLGAKPQQGGTSTKPAAHRVNVFNFDKFLVS